MENLIDDDGLGRQLRKAGPYIDDAGFTSRVLGSLPARPASARLRSAILITMTALASVLAYFLSGRGGFVNDFVMRVSELPMMWLLAVTFGAGIVIGAPGLTAAGFKSRDVGLITRSDAGQFYS